MPVKRQLNGKQVSESINSINRKIERFASNAELQQRTVLDKNALPTVGMTIKFNQYEHDLLRNVARLKGRSMQKQIKRILIRELEKYIF